MDKFTQLKQNGMDNNNNTCNNIIHIQHPPQNYSYLSCGGGNNVEIKF